MNHRKISDARLFLDRPLTETADDEKTPSTEPRHALFDLVSDGRAELLDTLLQILLVVCLFSTFAVCGWELGNLPGTGAVDQEVALQQHHGTPARAATPQVTAAQPSGRSPGKVTLPRIANPLTVSPKLF